MTKFVPPSLGLSSFSCPHCGAYTHQTWFQILIEHFPKETKPSLTICDDNSHKIAASIKDPQARKDAVEFFARLEQNRLTFYGDDHNHYSKWYMVNASLSRCYTCEAFAVWIEDKIVYPINNAEIIAHEDMPGEIKEDFNEAALIVDRSPRGAAALLRLSIQKLMPRLGQTGKDLNADIRALVQKGLGPDLAQAMDILRVIGNNAVHPGQIDLKDNSATARKLFEVLNLIVERLISTPKKVQALFEGLPSNALAQIKDRDNNS